MKNNIVTTTEEVIPEGKKKCACCGRILDISAFSKSSRNKTGYQSWCKECSNKRSKQWFSENKEYRAKYKKELARTKQIASLKEQLLNKDKDEKTEESAGLAIQKRNIKAINPVYPMESTTATSLTSYSTQQLVSELMGRGKTILVDPEPRELMIALHNKGYHGKLQYTEIRTIDLDTIAR